MDAKIDPPSGFLKTFARDVKARKASHQPSYDGSTELMFRIPGSCAALHGFHQQTIWRYRMKAKTDYVLQVIRYDSFDLNGDRTPTESGWEVTVHNDTWGECFSNNVGLKMGDRADWDSSVPAFFPADKRQKGLGTEPGLEGFIDQIRLIVTVLSKDW